MTFSFRPTRSSFLPRTAASVRTRVVFWNEAAERKLSVARTGLGDAEQHPVGLRLLAVAVADAGVLVLEHELVHDLARQEAAVARMADLALAEHLPHDHLDVLVVDVDAAWLL